MLRHASIADARGDGGGASEDTANLVPLVAAIPIANQPFRIAWQTFDWVADEGSSHDASQVI